MEPVLPAADRTAELESVPAAGRAVGPESVLAVGKMTGARSWAADRQVVPVSENQQDPP